MRTPSESAARRSPCASRAGCTVAPVGSKTPAMWRSEPERRLTVSGSQRSNGCCWWRSRVSSRAFQEPFWGSLVAAQSQPSPRKCASIPRSAQKRPISPTASAEARARRTASSDSQNLQSEPNLAHQLSTKPPLRPLGPLPHRSFSTIAMSMEGSRSFRRIAVHSPQKPPPTMQTSARSSPSSAGAASSGASPASVSQWLSIRSLLRSSAALGGGTHRHACSASANRDPTRSRRASTSPRPPARSIGSASGPTPAYRNSTA